RTGVRSYYTSYIVLISHLRCRNSPNLTGLLRTASGNFKTVLTSFKTSQDGRKTPKLSDKSEELSNGLKMGLDTYRSLILLTSSYAQPFLTLSSLEEVYLRV